MTSPNDMQFQTTCRSAGVATVFLSQNVSNFYAALGNGERGKVEADSIFANLNTKIFHANGDPVTNEWGSSLIGRSRQFLMNSSSSDPVPRRLAVVDDGMELNAREAGLTEHIDFEVEPREFTTPSRGGRANRWRVDGIVFQGGRRFRATGKTWMPITFNQKK